MTFLASSMLAWLRRELGKFPVVARAGYGRTKISTASLIEAMRTFLAEPETCSLDLVERYPGDK